MTLEITRSPYEWGTCRKYQNLLRLLCETEIRWKNHYPCWFTQLLPGSHHGLVTPQWCKPVSWACCSCTSDLVVAGMLDTWMYFYLYFLNISEHLPLFITAEEIVVLVSLLGFLSQIQSFKKITPMACSTHRGILHSLFSSGRKLLIHHGRIQQRCSPRKVQDKTHPDNLFKPTDFECIRSSSAA